MRLFVVGDDFGYSIRRDQGILHSLRLGLVQNVCLLVNGVSASSAARAFHDLQRDTMLQGGNIIEPPQLCLGLHLNLSEGIPICAPHLIPSLVHADNGTFLGKLGFVDACIGGKIAAEDVEREARAQYDKFVELVGHAPAFFNGHNHVHVFSPVLETVAKTFGECYGEKRHNRSVKSLLSNANISQNNSCDGPGVPYVRMPIGKSEDGNSLWKLCMYDR